MLAIPNINRAVIERGQNTDGKKWSWTYAVWYKASSQDERLKSDARSVAWGDGCDVGDKIQALEKRDHDDSIVIISFR